MDIPKQVLAQQEEVERIERELAPPEPEPQAAPEPPTSAEPVVEPVQEPQSPPEPTPSPPLSAEEATWERRFKSLKGKYDAEVPRLHGDLRDLRQELEALKAAAKTAPPEPTPPETPLVTEKDVENFGSDLLDVIERKARQVSRDLVTPEMAELKAQNQKLRDELDGVNQRQVSNDQQGYFNELVRQVPDWQDVNTDPLFHEWLAEVDQFSGSSRQAYLDSAFNARDVNRTAALFNAFKQTLVPQPQANANRAELERQVAPVTSRSTPTTTTPNSSERVWSSREIELFYLDVAKGKYADRPDEAKRVENEIDLAVASGRVRAG